jgi:hypothetical protein
LAAPLFLFLKLAFLLLFIGLTNFLAAFWRATYIAIS